MWSESPKILILIGGCEPETLSQEVIKALAADPSIVVMTEITSNVHHPTFLSNIDTIITPFDEQAFLELQPDLLVTIGGMIVSKRVKSFLRQYRPKQHWHVDVLRAYDTFGCLTDHICSHPDMFLNHMLRFTERHNSDYALKAREIKSLRKLRHDVFINNAPFSDLKAFEQIMATLPKDSILQISNSSPIRYAQLFETDPSIDVYCNRGTSGIDGSTSTAIGAAAATNKQTILITGDVSFLYDSNALWNNYIPKNFKIILLNNGGGGIFRILPGHAENEVFNTYFETSHCLTAEHLAKMYRFRYITASDETTLKNGLIELYSDNESPAILEIFTPTKLNDKILLDYFNQLA